MTDTKTETPVSPAPDATATPGNSANKAFWAGVGIGSAAIVAGLMYATRSRRKK
jgi:hypothetical protein